MDKSKIKNAAFTISNYVIDNLPQEQDGKIMWYYSGSMVWNLIAQAKSIKLINLDKNGNVVNFSNSPIQISTEANGYFTEGVRQMTGDIDVIATNTTYLTSENDNYCATQMKKFRDNYPEESKILCPAWTGAVNANCLEVLSDDRVFEGYHLAEINLGPDESGEDVLVYITNPVDLLMHKIAEALTLDPGSEKFQKDIKDIATMYNGLASLGLIPDDVPGYMNDMLQINPAQSFDDTNYSGTCFDRVFVIWVDEVPEYAPHFFSYVEPYIAPEHKESFGEFAEEVTNFTPAEMSSTTM